MEGKRKDGVGQSRLGNEGGLGVRIQRTKVVSSLGSCPYKIGKLVK